MTTEQPEQTIVAIFHQTGPRCLEMFVESIREADRCGGDKWGVTHYEKDRVRLVVGSVVVCTLHVGGIWFALDKDFEDSTDYTFIDQRAEWKATPEYDYKAVPSISGMYYPPASKIHKQNWGKIKKMHFALIDKAASKYRKLRVTSKKAHSKAFMDYLRQRLDDPTIPDPK